MREGLEKDGWCGTMRGGIRKEKKIVDLTQIRKIHYKVYYYILHINNICKGYDFMVDFCYACLFNFFLGLKKEWHLKINNVMK